MDTQKKDVLDDALAAWRGSSQEEALSAAARTALFGEVQAMGEESSLTFVPGLTRVWRWAFLGSVPVVALSAFLMVAGDHARQASEPELSAAKLHGQLVFTVANGDADRLIYRSTDPQAFDRSAAVKMSQNRYMEVATGGPSLVFYRID